MEVVPIRRGESFDLYALNPEGGNAANCEVVQFLQYLKENDRASSISLTRLLTYIADVGPPRNERKSRALGDYIYELKTTRGARLFYFFHPREDSVILLTHGWTKGPSREQTRQIRRAQELRQNFLAELG